MKRVMVVAAHADDEILGAGGTLLRHRDQGDKVYALLVTRATHPEWTQSYIVRKEAEIKRASLAMGFHKLIRLDLPAFQLNTMPIGRFNKLVASIIHEYKPDIIYTHYEKDINVDHQLVHEAVRVAARPNSKYRPTVYEFETISSSEWSSTPFQAQHYVNIEKYLSQKLKALGQYRTEVKSWPHPRSLKGVETLARKRGSEVYLKAAEAFRLVTNVDL